MERRLTWFLFGAAICLAIVIYFVDSRIPGSVERREPKRVLPLASADEIQGIEVTLPGSGMIRAERTNGVWVLTEPHYAARQREIDLFAKHLLDLRAFDRVAAHEVKLQGEGSFGLLPPRAQVNVLGASNAFHLEIGGIAPLTSNLFVRVSSTGEVVLASPDLLEGLPRSTNDWRTPALFQLSAREFDHIEVRTGQRSFELGRGINNAWQILKPVPARADQDRVLELLEVLRGADATAFVTDAPGADLERFGLQTPEAEVSFLAGTNRLYAMQFGNSPTNQTNQTFVLLLGQTNVVLAPRQLAEYLKQPYKAYHDPRLVTILPGALDRVVVRAPEEFALQRQPSGSWLIEGENKMPVDPQLFRNFIETASGLRIVDIVKELPTETDLKALGFVPPRASYSFFQKLTNAGGLTTNVLFTDVNFGRPQTDTIPVRRSDENPVYLTQLSALVDLPKHAFELRDRRIWRFATNAVVRISLANGNATNTVARGPSGWSNDPIVSAQIEEIVYRLSRLDAQEWVDKGNKRLGTFGVTSNSPRLLIEVREATGEETYELHLGRQTLRRDAYAATIFPGETEPTLFEFPGDLHQLMLQGLPFPK